MNNPALQSKKAAVAARIVMKKPNIKADNPRILKPIAQKGFSYILLLCSLLRFYDLQYRTVHVPEQITRNK